MSKPRSIYINQMYHSCKNKIHDDCIVFFLFVTTNVEKQNSIKKVHDVNSYIPNILIVANDLLTTL